ncbi:MULTISPECIES: DUF2165 family protein [unclassified Bartonella]|uniref:DUF2165 family protein n=1 Tax=unclassified Bartonella TaxID=2645622 RepID=UPI0015FB8B9F|nr:MULTISPECIES: DUF2165 domain-containing protein [unclassified Bartonella]UXN04974.1 DUF2165 domain-containing protein [Bartonella sp. HY406]UXN08029.1 DUF2165 domain-containing protein [Bartonella sp. HY761]
MILRLSKALMVCAIAFFTSLVVFGNVTDYNTNFQFVHHVFMMDTIPPEASIHYRAINSNLIHNLGYIGIMSLEFLTALLCWIGGIKMLLSVKASAKAFKSSKTVAIAGLTIGFLVWQVAFMSVGGEWFGMWMSKQWNGVPDAFRFFITIIMVLLYIIQPDGELEKD